MSLATEALALGALADPGAATLRQAAIMREQRRLADVLRDLGCEVLNGLGNFVTFRPPNARSLSDALKRGLVLREFRSGPMKGWLRATARASDENDLLIAALRETLGE